MPRTTALRALPSSGGFLRINVTLARNHSYPGTTTDGGRLSVHELETDKHDARFLVVCRTKGTFMTHLSGYADVGNELLRAVRLDDKFGPLSRFKDPWICSQSPSDRPFSSRHRGPDET